MSHSTLKPQLMLFMNNSTRSWCTTNMLFDSFGSNSLNFARVMHNIHGKVSNSFTIHLRCYVCWILKCVRIPLSGGFPSAQLCILWSDSKLM